MAFSSLMLPPRNTVRWLRSALCLQHALSWCEAVKCACFGICTSFRAECKRTQPEHTASQRLKNIDVVVDELTPCSRACLRFIHCDEDTLKVWWMPLSTLSPYVIIAKLRWNVGMSKTLKPNMHLCFLFLNIAHLNIKYFKKIFRICDVLNSLFWAIMKAAVLQGLELIIDPRL